MPAKHRPFKLVLFDVGNTLLYAEQSFDNIVPRANEAMYAALLEMGYARLDARFPEVYDQRTEEYYHLRAEELVEYSSAIVLRRVLTEYGYKEVSDAHIGKALRAFYSVTQANWIPEADTVPMLQVLQGQGYRLGVISNAADTEDIYQLLDKVQARPYFEQILVSAEVGIRKPHPRIFEMALEHFGMSAQETAMVGDTLAADILGANQLGIGSVWITRRADRPDNHLVQAKIQPDVSIAALSDLPNLLAAWPVQA